MCGNNKHKSIKKSLELIGIPLTVGVVSALIATIAFITATTPQWMTGVTKALETEEKASLQRLSVAQAAYSEEIMGQMVTETNLMTEYALQLFMTKGYTSPSTNQPTNLNPSYNFSNTEVVQGDPGLPTGTWMWGYPFSSTANVLEVGTVNGPSAGDKVRESSVCTSTYTTNCWTEPPGGDVKLRDDTQGSLKSTMVMWPPQLGVNVSNLPRDLMEEIRITGYLENVMSEIYNSNPTAVSVYIGTERNGIMRQFPYAHQTTGLAKTRYAAKATPPFSTEGGAIYHGYDPRKRPWYAEAKYKKTLIVSAPYVYSTPPFPMGITVAKPILHPVTGELFGVIGFDVTVSLLESVILSSTILYNGYAFLLNTEGRSVVYPCSRFTTSEACQTHHRCAWNNKNGKETCSTPDKSFYSNLEFDAAQSQDVVNLKTFDTDFWSPKMKVLKQGSGIYYKYDSSTKKNTMWHIAYAPIKVSNYILALVVPDEDIQLPSTIVSSTIGAGIAAQVSTYIIVTAVGLFLFLLVLKRVSHIVVKPVKSLKQVIDLIIADLNRQKEDGGQAAFQLNISELIKEEDEACKEVSMMKDSFEYMVTALRVGKRAFAKNDLNAAQKVYDDALTMYQNLNNPKGIGICNFNCGATSHRRWLKSDKKDMAAYEHAMHYYTRSINIAREQWVGLNRSDSEGTWSRNDSDGFEQGGGACNITVTIEMTSNPPKQRRASSLNMSGQKNHGDATVKGVNLGASGHDIADRLSGRLYQMGQLYFDRGRIVDCVAAEPLLQEALLVDEQTNNLLGYAMRVGLLCKIMVILNRYDEANAKIKQQLDILRERLLRQEENDEAKDIDDDGASTLKRSTSIRNHEQERDELFQALQHCLKDAAIVQGCSMGDDHLAMRYFIESLSCAPRSEPYVINSVFRELHTMLSDANCNLSLPPPVLQLISAEVNKRGASQQLPKDMVFVIDYSGSMSGGKMRKARDNTMSLMSEQLQAKDRASIVQFNSKVTMLTPDMLFAHDPQVVEAVRSMKNPHSGTALWDGIGAAYDQLDYAANQLPRGQEREKWIIVVTDGEDNRSQANTPASLSQRLRVGNANIIILAVGVADDGAQRAMAQVAGGNRNNDDLIGELIAIDNSAMLAEAFAQIATMIGDHVRVEQH